MCYILFLNPMASKVNDYAVFAPLDLFFNLLSFTM